MSIEPSWLREYLEDLSREAGLTGPTEDPPGGGFVYFDEVSEVPEAVWLGLVDLIPEQELSAMKSIGKTRMSLALAEGPGDCTVSSPKLIDEMTLADYRRGVANMKTRYV